MQVFRTDGQVLIANTDRELNVNLLELQTVSLVSLKTHGKWGIFLSSVLTSQIVTLLQATGDVMGTRGEAFGLTCSL